MATREGDREMKVFEWKEELKSYWKDSHKKVGGLGFLNGMIVFCLFAMIILILSQAVIVALIGDNSFLHESSDEMSGGDKFFAGLYMILLAFCSAYLTYKISVNIKIKRYQKTKKLIESEFGELDISVQLKLNICRILIDKNTEHIAYLKVTDRILMYGNTMMI